MKTKNLTVWLGEHTNVRTIEEPCREPLAEQMEPGDVDDLGRVLVVGLGLATWRDNGRVWVRPDQARAAGYYGWRDVVLGSLGVVTSNADGATLFLIER